MNAVHETVDGTKESVPVPASTAKNAVAGRAREPLGENDQRATEIGPILEEILSNHWEHWGLND